jgi:hypothetical protein
MTAIRSASTHGAPKHTCRELYSEAILLPRVAMLVLAVAFCAALVMCMSRRSRRHGVHHEQLQEDEQLKAPTEDAVSVSSKAPVLPTASAPATDAVWRRRMKLAIVAGFVWTAMFLVSFSSYNFMSTEASSGPGRPRMVFSFTTTASSIDKIQPTLAALVNQSGEGFDTIYVVVPRVYRDERVTIPDWLVAPDAYHNASEFYGWKYALAQSAYHTKVQVLIIDKDFGPGSKVLGTLLVEQEPETIIVYGDDDRQYPRELAHRTLYYTTKFPREAVAVLGGWISTEDALYCGRSLEIGINRVSFVGGAGGVVVRRKFYGHGVATTAAFAVTELSKACFLGDDYYLSLVLSRNGIRRRVVYDSCWSINACEPSFGHWGLSGGKSSHPGGANVEHYQQCIRELGEENDLSVDAEFGQLFMMLFSRAWGVFRMLYNLVSGNAIVGC